MRHYRRTRSRSPRYRSPRYRRNPSSGDGLSTDTVVLLFLGTGLIGAIIYAIYQISEAQETLEDTNDQIADAVTTAQGIQGQIPGAVQAAQNVSGSISQANQTAQSATQSPLFQGVNSAVSAVQGWLS
jgi:hypothetical protein